MTRKPGDSSEQQSAEKFILDAVASRIGVPLQGRSIAIDAEARPMEVDGYAANPLVLCEAWAHIGPPKGGQLNKVMTDALKLTVGRASIGSPSEARLILAFCDQQAAAPFRGSSWRAAALRHLGIEVMVVEIPDGIRVSVSGAQQRQRR